MMYSTHTGQQYISGGRIAKQETKRSFGIARLVERSKDGVASAIE